MDTWIPNQMFGKGTCLSNMAISGVQHKSIPYFAPHTLYQSLIAQFAMHSFWYEHTSLRVYSKFTVYMSEYKYIDICICKC